MNIFVIPSWYPASTNPLAGIFTKEQVEALAEFAPEHRLIVSLWGHSDSELPVRKPWVWHRYLLWRFRQKIDQITFRHGVTEIFNPKIHWSNRLPFGGARQLVRVNRRNYLLALRRFKKIDLIHAHVSYPAGYIASLLSQEFGIPYVVTEHMGPFPFSAFSRDQVPLPEISQAFCNASLSIAVSPELSERIASFGYPLPVVIPNMVDERVFFPSNKMGKKTIFLTMCRICHEKGIEELLDAISLWNPHADSVEFRIGGDGPMLKEYKARARSMGLDDRVKWLGGVSRDQAPAIFRDCNVFVMASHYETFGVVYAEAIASGKPIIATRCGGPEFIVSDINGKLVEVGDVVGLIRAMEYMSQHWMDFDPKAIRIDFEQRFSRAAVVGQLLKLYNNVTGY